MTTFTMNDKEMLTSPSAICSARWLCCKRAFMVVFILLVQLNCSHSTWAADAIWNTSPTNGNWEAVGGENNWDTGANTFPGALNSLTNGDVARFHTSSTTTIAIDATTSNSSPLGIAGIKFGISGSTPSSFTIGSTSGNSLLLSSGGTTDHTISFLSGITGTNITQTVDAPLVLEPASSTTAGTYQFSNATTNSATNKLVIGGTVTGGTTTSNITLTLAGGNTGANTIQGVISDGGAAGGVAITKTANGTWALSGSGNNTYTGTTTINGGILTLNKTAATAIAGNVTIGDATGVDILQLSGTGGNQIANSSILTFNGTGANAGTLRMNALSETVGGLVSTGGAGIAENNTSGTSTLTLDVNTTDRSFSGILQNGTSGILALTKTGTATQTLSGASTFTGATTISGGTLELGSSGALASTTNITVNTGGTLLLSGTGDQVNNAATATLAGGTIQTNGAASVNETVGALTLSSTSTIDFGTLVAGNTLSFADSSAAPWSGTLNVLNWTSGTDHLFFGSSSSGLTGAQLSQINLYSDSGTTFLGNGGINGFGEISGISAVPEPSSAFVAMSLLALIGWRERRWFLRCPEARRPC